MYFLLFRKLAEEKKKGKEYNYDKCLSTRVKRHLNCSVVIQHHLASHLLPK